MPALIIDQGQGSNQDAIDCGFGNACRVFRIHGHPMQALYLVGKNDTRNRKTDPSTAYHS
jgi:hypothetical protein